MKRGGHAGYDPFMGDATLLPRTAAVSWRGLLLVLLFLVVLSAAAGAGAAWWVMLRFTLHLPLQPQQVEVRLPEDLPVQVEVAPQDPDSAADVPMQSFPVRVNDTFRTVVRVDTRVPVRMRVPFRGEVPVNLDLPINTRVKTRVLGLPLEVPVEGVIPLRFSLPVDMVIPIDQVIPMKFDLPVRTHIDQTVRVQVQTRQTARIHLHDPTLAVTLQAGEIAVPLSWLSLVGPGNGEPTRLGPLVQPPLRP
jgi:hypothetical protein